MTDDEHFEVIQNAIHAAERVLALADVENDDFESDEYQERFEAVYHCEVCTVRSVMEVVWPPILDFVTELRAQITVLDARVNDLEQQSQYWESEARRG